MLGLQTRNLEQQERLFKNQIRMQMREIMEKELEFYAASFQYDCSLFFQTLIRCSMFATFPTQRPPRHTRSSKSTLHFLALLDLRISPQNVTYFPVEVSEARIFVVRRAQRRIQHHLEVFVPASGRANRANRLKLLFILCLPTARASPVKSRVTPRGNMNAHVP
jgi:hypothetical protein